MVVCLTTSAFFDTHQVPGRRAFDISLEKNGNPRVGPTLITYTGYDLTTVLWPLIKIEVPYQTAIPRTNAGPRTIPGMAQDSINSTL